MHRAGARRLRRARAGARSTGRPASTGDSVRKSSSTRPCASSSPNVDGPASASTSECPRLAQQLERGAEIDEVAVVHRDDVRHDALEPRRTAHRRQHDGVARAPDASGSSEAPVVTTATAGCSDLPSRARKLRERALRRPDRRLRAASARSATRAACREPISTTSANARSRPITNLSSSLSSAISAFERSSPGIATTPSSVSTKFAYTHWPVEAELAGVERAQLVRQLALREAVLLPEELEAHGSSGAHLVEELAPQVGVLVVEPAPERRDRARPFLLDAAHLRAEMGRLEVHRDAARRDELDERVRDLLAEPLLHREAARVEPDEPRQLRDAEDLAVRDVRDVRRRRGTAARDARRARRTRSAPRRSGCASRRRRADARTGTPCAASRRRRSPPVASNIARRKRRGVSRVPGVSRSMPNAVRISATLLLVAHPLLRRDRALVVWFRPGRELNDVQAKPPDWMESSDEEPGDEDELREQEPHVRRAGGRPRCRRRRPRAATTCRAARARRPFDEIGAAVRAGAARRAGPASRRARRRPGRAPIASQAAGAPRARRSTLKLTLSTAVSATKPSAASERPAGVPPERPRRARRRRAGRTRSRGSGRTP